MSTTSIAGGARTGQRSRQDHEVRQESGKTGALCRADGLACDNLAEIISPGCHLETNLTECRRSRAIAGVPALGGRLLPPCLKGVLSLTGRRCYLVLIDQDENAARIAPPNLNSRPPSWTAVSCRRITWSTNRDYSTKEHSIDVRGTKAASLDLRNLGHET